MAVLQTTVWKVRPGKAQDFMANVATARKIVEKLGAQTRFVNQMVGTNAPAFIVIIESKDWNAFGALQAKMQTDSEWQAFFMRAVANNPDPAADLIGTGLSSDVQA
jgi:hypothetical protein